MFSRPKILFLVSLLFVALLNSIPTYHLFLNFLIIYIGSGVDFDSSPINITFTPDDYSRIVNIPVMCDRLIEETELFDINLSVISASHNVTVELGLRRSIGEIFDSTGLSYAIDMQSILLLCHTVYVQFEQLAYSIREDIISLSPVIVLSRPSWETLRLPINIMDVDTTGTLCFMLLFYTVM